MPVGHIFVYLGKKTPTLKDCIVQRTTKPPDVGGGNHTAPEDE